jgi:homopolymeric O-antigen transport system permease protein
MLLSVRSAAVDIFQALRKTPLGFMLGMRDAFSNYRLAALGPLWITLQAALWVSMLSYIFFDSLGGGEYIFVVYVATGYVFFQLGSNIINDGVTAFRRDAGTILNIPNPTFLSITRVFWKSILIWCVHIPIAIGAFVIFSDQHVFLVGYFVFGMVLFCLTMVGAALLLANICLLIPDLAFLTQAVMRILFFGTPIVWQVEQRAGLRRAIAEVNPFTHLIEIVRAPFMGVAPDTLSIAVALCACLLVWLLGFFIFAAMKPRLAARL